MSKKLCVWRRIRAKFASAALEFLANFSRLWRAARSRCIVFTDGRCQQLTPPESRKIWSFRQKSKNISYVFLLLFFFTFLANFLGIFDFLALLSARSRRVLANREERIKKENFLAFFWPVEICEILVRLLIVKVNKLVYIITRRNRLGSG